MTSYSASTRAKIITELTATAIASRPRVHMELIESFPTWPCTVSGSVSRRPFKYTSCIKENRMKTVFCCNCHEPKIDDLLTVGPDEMPRCDEHHDWLINQSPTAGLRKAWYLRKGPFREAEAE